MCRSVIAALAALSLLAGCVTGGEPETAEAPALPAPSSGSGPSARQQLTAAAHALFVDVCVRYLGQAEPLLRRAAQRNLVLIEDDIRPRSAPTESVRLYGVRAPNGSIVIGMLVNTPADSCAVAITQRETELALALASQMALVWSRGGSRVTPMTPPGRPDIDARMFFRVQSTGEAARRPAPDWIFGVTMAADGSGMFQAILAPPDGSGAPEEREEDTAPPPSVVPRGILRTASPILWTALPISSVLAKAAPGD